MYQLTRDAAHKLGSLNDTHLLSHSSGGGSLRTRGSEKENLFAAFGSFLAIFGIFWLIEASLDLCLHLYVVFLSVQISPFYENISHMGVGPILMTSS